MTNVLAAFTKMQTEAMQLGIENAKNMPQTFMTMFTNPTEAFNSSFSYLPNSKEIIENTKKFQTAFVNYNLALSEMMTASYNTFELVSKELTKSK